MTGEDEDLATATSPAARKPGRRRSESAKTVSPEESAAVEETAPTDEPGSTPAEETSGAPSESNSELADRLDEVARATVNHLLRRYFRGVESGGRETAELEIRRIESSGGTSLPCCDRRGSSQLFVDDEPQQLRDRVLRRT